ncbi:MAG: BlaI/MecI/CopY family transcriptional regulator [Planctomycetaceae bacterium]|nr:BlaI/MecI/CopY family transcriptional regulator [Planctomycetaceae bacterium]MBL8872886.1 BlaI/MecI/CopY family transcriptional regulator [Planctomycetaceae bacterium]MBN8600868.1 BlaI/MecI/CopY family transcriptional regulator [Planctomycetota bacterium]
MSSRPSLSKGEMEVARVLWEIGAAGVREVFETLSNTSDMDYTTVQTYLRRLETKGYASSKLKGRLRIYTAKGRPGTVIRETVNDLVDRLFGGQSLPLVRHLIEDRGMSPKEIHELKVLLDQYEDDDSCDD